MQENKNSALELSMQELEMEELEGMEAPDWWNSFLVSFGVSAGVSATYSSLVITSVVAT
ncbi:daptide-type RiPP [Streptomyces misionensis]|uniref:daptide-type RiPP n=1 Tax=Streptomyces misionensis TaxID=67331 RepID=UPI001648BD11|nr:daptide-type RiPP [Streptomyces misionensis]